MFLCFVRECVARNKFLGVGCVCCKKWRQCACAVADSQLLATYNGNATANVKCVSTRPVTMGFATTTKLKCKDEVSHALKGKYHPVSVAKYGRERLEKTVTRLVNVTTNNHKPQWWPDEVVFAHSLQDLKKLIPDSVWNQMLRRLVLLCRDFYTPKKCVLREINNLRRPVVYLKDICRVVEKDQFVRGLGLVRVGGSHVADAAPPTVAKPIRLAGMPHVPFSSDYGQLLIKREKTLPLEGAHLKRLERLQRYLKNHNEVNNPAEYPVTYDKRDDQTYCHLYRFPVKQAYQMRDKVEFLKSLCKPVRVILQRYDIPRKKKVLRVVLTRLKLETVKLRRRNNRINYKI